MSIKIKFPNNWGLYFFVFHTIFILCLKGVKILRNTLSHFGWIVVIIVVLSILIGAATPAGQNLMDKMFDFADKLTQDGVDNGLVNPDSLYNISVINAPEGLLVPSKETACQGEIITVTLTNTEDYYCDGIKLSYNGRDNNVESMSFKMPDGDVTISPIWGEFPYSKIYFTSSYDAGRVAQGVKDNAYNTRLPVVVDGVEHYVVYDYSEILGYNDNLLYSEKYAEKDSIVKVVTGASCKAISTSAFKDCSNLKEVFISKSVEKIERAAFYNCGKLNTLVIDEGLKEIQDSAFYNCNSLGYDGDVNTDLNDSDSSLILPVSLKIIGGSSFAHTAYEKVIIPHYVHTVGNFAFFGTEITDSNISYSDKIANIYENSFTIN